MLTLDASQLEGLTLVDSGVLYMEERSLVLGEALPPLGRRRRPVITANSLSLPASSGTWVVATIWLKSSHLANNPLGIRIAHENWAARLRTEGVAEIDLGRLPCKSGRMMFRLNYGSDTLVVPTGFGGGEYPLVGWRIGQQLVGIASVFFEIADSVKYSNSPTEPLRKPWANAHV